MHFALAPLSAKSKRAVIDMCHTRGSGGVDYVAMLFGAQGDVEGVGGNEEELLDAVKGRFERCGGVVRGVAEGHGRVGEFGGGCWIGG